MPQEVYNVTFYLPAFPADTFSTHADNTVSEFLGQVYMTALLWTKQEDGEKMAVIVRLEGFPLGPFILPFEDEEVTAQMREMTVAEFFELLWKDWREAFRILPANAHSKVAVFLAATGGQ